MRLLAIACLFILIPGCKALSAVGVDANDVIPTLRNCSDVKYDRNQTEVTITAKCKVPVG